MAVSGLTKRFQMREYLSEYYLRLLKRGEEEKFWNAEHIVLIDTSFMVNLHYRRSIGADLSVCEMHEEIENEIAVIIPEVLHELNGLEEINKVDNYGTPIFSRNWINDLNGEEMPDLRHDSGLEAEIEKRWKRVSPRYGEFLRLVRKAENGMPPLNGLAEPQLTYVDKKIMALALMRAREGKPTRVATGDMDISSVIESIEDEQWHPVYAVPHLKWPSRLGHSVIRQVLGVQRLFVIPEAIAEIRNAQVGDYLVIAKWVKLYGQIGKSVAVGVSRQKVKDVGYRNVMIFDGDSVWHDGDFTDLFKRHLAKEGMGVIKTQFEANPLVYQQVYLKPLRNRLHDLSGTFFDVSIDTYLSGRDLTRKELEAKRREIIQYGVYVICPVDYMLVGDSFSARYLPDLRSNIAAAKERLVTTQIPSKT